MTILQFNKGQVIQGDSLEVLKNMKENSVDSIVTDPPYEIGFMGKSWDNTGIAYNVEFWRECLRVLKPGGHLLSFSATRTYHRMAVAIEDAGFEIRDMIEWVYGSGFPKSMDISKTIDKQDGTRKRKEERHKKQLKFTTWLRETGTTAQQINEATGTNMGSHYTTLASQPAIPTREHFEKIKPLLSIEVPDWVEQFVDERTAEFNSIESENFKKREVIGTKEVNGEEGTAGGYKNGIASLRESDISVKREIDITTAFTPEAKAWEGWGTALKPAHEPIVLARKPLQKKTVAENVLEHGTGGINIDASRIAYNEPIKVMKAQTSINSMIKQSGRHEDTTELKPEGRFPANFIISSDVAPILDEQAPDSSRYFLNVDSEYTPFIYTPKASKKERGSFNLHPTVKPLKLMSYLVALVTPSNGTVLDPFAGSGSTLLSASENNFHFIGIEREDEYIDIITKRLEQNGVKAE